MKKGNFLDELNDEAKQARGTWRRMLVLMALLLVAGLLLWRSGFQQADMGTEPTATPTITPTATLAPTTGRTIREMAYEKDVAALMELINNAKAEDAILNQAAQQLAKMIQNHQTELGIEDALVKAGFQPCMVLLQNDALTVTVGAQELTGAESATILSVCAAHTDVALDNIRIMTGESF